MSKIYKFTQSVKELISHTFSNIDPHPPGSFVRSCRPGYEDFSMLNQLKPAYTQTKKSQMQMFTNTTKSLTGFSRWMISLLIILSAIAMPVTKSFGQASILNYSFNAATNGSLEDLSTGSTTIMTGNNDDLGGTVTALGFNFTFMGVTYTHFSANSNGQMMLHTSAGATAAASQQSSPSAGLAILAPFTGDNEVNNGIRIKTIGTAPNRKFVVEWNQFYVNFVNITNAGNMQVWLNEGSGVINYVYGEIYNSSSSSQSRSIFLASSNTATTAGSITIGAPSTFAASATLVSNTIDAGNGLTVAAPLITNIGSSANGSRVIFTWTPPATAPANASFLAYTAVTASTTTVNWNDESTNEVGFVLTRATDAGFTQNVVSTPVNSTTAATTGTTYSSIQSGLLPGTTYYYKVVTLNEAQASAGVTSSQATSAAGVIVSTGTGGNWSATTTWLGGVVPTATDDVTISDGTTVTIDNASAVCNNLTVGQGTSGILNWSATAAGTVTIASNLTVAANGNFAANGTGTKSVIIGGLATSGAAGSLIVNGTYNMSVAGVLATTTFRGAADGVVSGSGTITFGPVVVNKGTTFTPVLDVTSVVTMPAPTAGGTRLTITTGTFKLSSASTLSPYFNAQTVAAAAGRLWLNNAGAIVQWVGVGTATGPGNVTVGGRLQITNGTFNSGSGSSTFTFTSGSGILEMSGGTWNHFGSVSFPSSAGTQLLLSGGNINVDPQAGAATTTTAFSIGASTTVNWSAGVITIVDPAATAGNTAWSASSGGSKTITGGTLRIGDGVSATTGGVLSNTSGFGIISSMPVWNLEINNRTDVATSRMARITGTTNVINNIEIKANGYLFNGSGTTTATIVLGGNLINEGTFAGTEPAGTQSIGTIQFSGAAAQTVSGAGSFTNLGSLSIANTGAGVTFSQTNQYNTLRVNRFQGNVLSANKITIGLGGTTASTVQYGQAAGTVSGGTFDVAPTFNLGSGVYTLLYLQEPAARTTGVEIPATRTAGNLTVNTTSGVVLGGGALTLSGALTLTAGQLTTTSVNLLTVAGSISGGSATSYVNGPLARTLPASTAAGTFVFPVGKGGYNPFELVSANTTAGGPVDVRAEVFDANAGGTPGTLMGTLNTSRYWAASITSGAANFTNTLVRLNDTRGTQDAIAASSTLTGAYNQIGGTVATLATGSITTTAPAVTSLPGFFLMGNLGAASVSGLTITPSTNQCVNIARNVTAVVTPGGGAIATVVINYSVNGTPQTAVTMTNTGGNNWAGTIPTVTPSNGTVTWSVVATDVNSLAGSAAGTSYKDEPLTGVTATATASVSPVCAGSPTVLTATLSAPVSATIGTAVTTTALTAQPTAFCNRWPSYRMQTIYTAAELTAAGLGAGNITSMSFNITSVGSASFTDNFVVRIGTTANSTVTGFESNAGYTTVFPAQTYNHAIGVNVITFSTPYAWNGVSNLIVEVQHEGADATNNSETFFTATAGNTVAYTAFSATDAASLSPNRLNVTFTGSSAPAITSVLWSNGSTTNPTTVNPTSTTTYTADITAAGCTVTSTGVEVVVNPLPTPPTGIPSTQCGIGTPGVQVIGGSIGTYRWYLVPTGGTALAGHVNDTLDNYSISTPTTFYVAIFNSITGCESPRTAVLADVISPDAITAVSSSASVCANNAGIDLSITQAGSNQNYVFTWTAAPEAGSGITGSVAGAATTGLASITPTLPGTYVYTVTGVDGLCTITSTITVVVKPLPSLNAAVATPGTICDGATVALSATTNVVTTGSIVLGAGATNSSATAASFFPGAWGGAKTQYIIRASELTALGLTAGNITSIGFEPTTSGQTYQGFAVNIGHTALASMTTAFVTTGLTQVYAGTLANNGFTPVANVVNTLTFGTGGTASSFAWDGTQNIIISICWSRVPTATTSTSSTMKVDAAGFTCSAYEQSDSETPAAMCAKITADGTGTLRPRFTINGQLLSVGAGSLTWSWDNGGGSGNSVSVTPSVTTTYTVTATDNVSGCSDTSQVLVVVNPLPAEPTATASEQCGTIIPTASVASTSGAPVPVFKWYTVPTGGVAVQTSTSTTFTSVVSTTTTFYVSEVSEFGCESTRVPVDITVSAPDVLTVSASYLSVCPGESFDISSAYSPDFNNFATFDLTVNNPAGSGITGTVSLTPNPTGSDPYTITPTAAGTYVYSITAFDPDKGCSSIGTVTVVVNPSPVITTFTATPTTICEGSTLNLAAQTVINAPGTASAIGAGASTSSAAGTPFYGGWGGTKVQYIYTAAELTAAGLSAGNITSLGLNVTVAGATTYNGFAISLGATAQSVFATANAITTLTQVYAGPLANSGVQTTVGLNTFTFSTPFAWNGTDNIVVSICYSNATTSNPASTVQTDSYTGFNRAMYIYADSQTPATVCGATTTIPASGSSGVSVVRPRTTFGGIVATNITSSNTWTFNPGAISGGTTGVATTLADPGVTSYTATATNSFGCSVTSDPVAVTVNPAPAAVSVTPSTQCGVGVPTASVTGAGGTFKWYSAATAGTLLQTGGATFTGSISTTTSFFVSETSAAGCEGPRTEVVATVTAPPALNIAAGGATTFCAGSNVGLDAASASDPSYVNFTWSSIPPTGAGLSATTGSSITAEPTVAGTYQILVVADDGIPVTGCTNSATITVVMNPNPVIDNASATVPTICVGGSTELQAFSSTLGGGPSGLPAEYCVPLSSGSSLITNVTFGSINNTVTQVSPFYDIYPLSTTVTAGQTYPLTVTSGTASIASVWIDFDRDGEYEASEWQQLWTSATTGTINITIPANATAGETGMRIRTRGTGSPNGNTDACTQFFSGGAQDYSINIVGLITQNPNYNYTWNPGALSGNNISVSPVSTTNYTVTVTNPGTGCFTTASTPVTVTVQAVGANVTATSSTVCSGLSTTLSANATGGAPFTYEWSDGTNIVGTAATLTVTPAATTTYTVTVRDACNNPVVSSLEIVVIASPVINAGSDVTFCYPGGEPVVLSASGAASYVWAPATGLSSTTGASVTASPAGTTTYTVTGTAANGCLGTDAVTVTVNPAVLNLVTTPPATVECAGIPVSISASASSYGPANQYIFSTATGGSLDPMTGATTIVGTGNDDTPMNTTGTTTSGNAVPIGFDFNFAGSNYTYFSASPDGWVTFANATTPSISDFSNGVTNTTNLPKVYPYWDDLATGTTGSVRYVVTGTAPDRILKVEWFVTIPRNTTGAANSRFQAWMYESGKVEFHYGTMNTGSMSASVGITGTVSQYRSVTVSSNTSSTSSANNTNAGQPASGRSYAFNIPSVTNFTWTPGSLTGATVNVAPPVNTTYTVTATTAAGCTATATVDVAVTNCPPLWTGVTSTDWNTGTNWRRGSAPLAGEDVTIGTGAFYPVLTSDISIGGTLDIVSGATLSIGANTLTVTGGVTANTGLLIGSNTSNLVLGATSSLRFSQIGTNGFLKDLNVNAGTTTLLAPLAITGGTGAANSNTYGTVTVAQGAVLASGGNLTFKSNISGTARLAEGAAAGNFVTGNVTVERYIPANRKRAWRMLSVPTISSQKINDAWQEGVSGAGLNPVQGFGTLITTNQSSPVAKGFDAQTPKASLQTFNSATNAFVDVLATKGAGAVGNITTNKGFAIFIRGSRGSGGQVNSPDTVTSPTVLRTTGTLYTGTQTPIAIGANRYELIGNTYPSAVDFLQLSKTGINSTLYIWDPKATTGTSLGAYQTFNPINGYLPLLPGSYGAGTVASPFVANTLVESGQAFLVQAGPAGGSIGMVESAKVAGTGVNMFRPTSTMRKIKTNLYKVNGSTTVMADANIAAFADGFSNDVDGDDAAKLANSGENLGIVRNNLSLVIEARQPIVENDTTQFSMWGMTQSQYRLEFVPTEMNIPGLTAILKDRFTGISTPIDLSANSVYNFTISADAASAGRDRFMIVYRQVQGGPLPVTFVSVAANKVGAAVKVDWKVAGERSIRGYEVERSADGVRFNAIGNVTATGNNGNDVTYNFTDAAPVVGTGYYRIKSTGIAGDIKYTYIVKVSVSNVKPGYAVSPNPVEGSVVNVQFREQAKGRYNIRLLNPVGQVVFTSVVEHAGGNSSQILNLPSAIARGAYQLEIIAPDQTRDVQNLLINTNK